MNLHFLVLTTLQSKGGSMNFTDLLNQLPIHTEGGNIYAILRELKRLGWISGDLCVGSTIRLTSNGLKAIFEQDTKQDNPSTNANPKRDPKRCRVYLDKFLKGVKATLVKIFIGVMIGVLPALILFWLGIG